MDDSPVIELHINVIADDRPRGSILIYAGPPDPENIYMALSQGTLAEVNFQVSKVIRAEVPDA